MTLASDSTKLLTATLLAACIALPGAAFAQQAGSAKAAFQQADVDGDRGLSAAEFRNFVVALASSGNKAALKVRDRNAYDRAFGRIDGDQNGIATVDEIRNARRIRKAGTGQNVASSN